MSPALGVCYYPEHWPEAIWAEDARRMADLGLSWVRIGEFAWSRLEPSPGDLRFDWLDRAIATLGEAGLRIVLGTPTATPPRWMLDRHPDMLAHDSKGLPRGFGSRRHYCFSHTGYKNESVRIATLLAERYGRNAHIGAWQTDNEYGCHDTVRSYSPAARAAFRDWLARKYVQIEGLNRAWGNVFWSMDYARFDQIDLPNLTVTEPNPSHVLDFHRFSSEQVVAFNRAQTDAIRAHSDAPVLHNYMGAVTDFDHFAVGDDLDAASWDSYPLGFLEDRIRADPSHKRAFARQGDPDFQAFHHDLYRAVGRGRWWVMEQQPGPVNWAPYNPAPRPGMVRLWSWEAIAHGAEVVSYFRWRQAPFAQEQMHAGLLRPDNQPAPVYGEVAEVAGELAASPEIAQVQAPVALIFDYESAWAWRAQPQGADFDYFALVFDWYRSLRALGQSIDILRPDTADLAGYAAIFAPGLMTLTPGLEIAIAAAPGQVVLGPRSNAKTTDMQIPAPLPPALDGFDCTVTHVESLRPDMPVLLERGGAITGWREHLEGAAETVEQTTDNAPVIMRQDNLSYIGGWLDAEARQRIFTDVLMAAGQDTTPLPHGLRIRDTASTRFVFNYADQPATFQGQELPACCVLRLTR